MNLIERLNDPEMCVDAIDEAINEIETLRARVRLERSDYLWRLYVGQMQIAAFDIEPREPLGAKRKTASHRAVNGWTNGPLSEKHHAYFCRLEELYSYLEKVGVDFSRVRTAAAMLGWKES